MSEKETKQIGRLAMRHEGNFWNAYYALPGTMNDAILLGSVHMKFVAEKEDRRKEFMDIMRECVADLIEEQCGKRPSWGGAHSAPESERSGHG